MRSPPAAIFWELMRKHRWGFAAVSCYVIIFGTIRMILAFQGQALVFADERAFAFAVVVPMSACYMYFLGIFSFGLSGDLSARRSIYPARKFALPVSSASLAGWPMLFGAVASAMLWLATWVLVLGGAENRLHEMGWPADYPLPVVWPAVFAAAILAWTQALTWMPYPFPGVRVVVAVFVMTMIDIVVLLAVYSRASELAMLFILVPLLPGAYFTAWVAVSRARRGATPDLTDLLSRLRLQRQSALRRVRLPFPGPQRAQAWFEWRRHGRSLPALVGLVLPFELSMVFLFRETPTLVYETLVAILLTPPFLAAFVAATVSRSNLGSDSVGVGPFISTRPLPNRSLVAATLEATVWSTVATWVLVLVAVPAAISLSGTWPVVFDFGSGLRSAIGFPRAITLALLSLGALVISTWKQLVQSLCIGLTGRSWIIKGSVFGALAFVTILVSISQWIVTGNRLVEFAWDLLPTILVCLALLKIAAAIWAASRLLDEQILSGRALVIIASVWTIAVLSLEAFLVWFFAFRFYLFAIIAILAIPLVRLSAAPLALAWNRHR